MEDHIFNIFEFVTSGSRGPRNDEKDPRECLKDLQTIIADYWDWLPDLICTYDDVQEARAYIATHYPESAGQISGITAVEVQDLETEAYNTHWQNKHLTDVVTNHDWVRCFRSGELPISAAVSALEVSSDTSCLDVLVRVNTILSNSIMLAKWKAKLAVLEVRSGPSHDSFQTYLWLRSSIIADILNEQVEFESRNLIKSAANATHVQLQKGQARIGRRDLARWALMYRTHLPPLRDLEELPEPTNDDRDMLVFASTHQLPPTDVLDVWGRDDHPSDTPYVSWTFLRQSAKELSHDPCYQRFARKVKAFCVAGGLPSDISEDILQNLAALKRHVWEKRAPGPAAGFIVAFQGQMQELKDENKILSTRNESLKGDLNKQSRIITNLSYRYLLEQLPKDKAGGPTQAWAKFFNDALETARTEKATDFMYPLANLYKGTDPRDIEGLREDGKKLYNRLSKNIHHYSATWEICGDWDEGERRIMNCLTPHKKSIKTAGIVDWDQEAKRHVKPVTVPASKPGPAAVPLIKTKKPDQYKWPESTWKILAAVSVGWFLGTASSYFWNTSKH